MNRIVFFCLAVLLGTSVYGQHSKLSLGLKILPGLADALYSDRVASISAKPRLGFNFGIPVFYAVKDSVAAIESGLYFMDKGSLQHSYPQLLETGYPEMYSRKIHTFYIAVPLLFRYYIQGFYISAGPCFEYRIGKKYESIGMWFSNSGTIWNIESKEFRLGFDINFGRQFSLTKRLSMDAEVSFHSSDYKYNAYLNYELGIGLNCRF